MLRHVPLDIRSYSVSNVKSLAASVVRITGLRLLLPPSTPVSLYFPALRHLHLDSSFDSVTIFRAQQLGPLVHLVTLTLNFHHHWEAHLPHLATICPLLQTLAVQCRENSVLFNLPLRELVPLTVRRLELQGVNVGFNLSSLSNLQHLALRNIPHTLLLLPPSLTYIGLFDCWQLRSVRQELLRTPPAPQIPFPLALSISISHCPLLQSCELQPVCTLDTDDTDTRTFPLTPCQLQKLESLNLDILTARRKRSQSSSMRSLHTLAVARNIGFTRFDQVLKTLSLDCYDAEDGSYLRSLRTLRSMHLRECPNLRCLVGFPVSLEVLSIHNAPLLESLQDLQFCDQLQRLSLQFCQKLEVVGFLPWSLESLQIRLCHQFRDFDFTGVRLDNLRQLTLTDCSVLKDTTVCDLLQRLPKLHNFELSDSYLCAHHPHPHPDHDLCEQHDHHARPRLVFPAGLTDFRFVQDSYAPFELLHTLSCCSDLECLEIGGQYSSQLLETGHDFLGNLLRNIEPNRRLTLFIDCSNLASRTAEWQKLCDFKNIRLHPYREID